MGQRTGRRYKAVSLARHLSLSLRLARSLIPTPSFASLLASLSLPRPAACTHEALAQATVTAPYIFPDSSGGGGSRVTIDIYKGGSSRCAFSPTLSLSPLVEIFDFYDTRERGRGERVERSYVPLYQPPFLRPTAPFLIPLESFLFFLSLLPSFYSPYSFEVYTGCLGMSVIPRGKNSCTGKM